MLARHPTPALRRAAAATIAATACDTINWLTALPGNPNRGGVLVHGGDRTFDFKGARALPWFMGG